VADRIDVDWDSDPLETEDFELEEGEGEESSSWAAWLVLAGLVGLAYVALRKPQPALGSSRRLKGAAQ